MKKLNMMKAFATAAVLVGFSMSASAQATATASCTATIITPISITKNVDMNFGNVAVSATLAGTVTLATNSTRTTGGAGGVTLPATPGTVTAADFTISGTGAYTYAITLPTSATITDPVSSATMTVNAFSSTPSGTGLLDAVTGNQDLTVGAVLSVSAAQTAGVYVNATGVPVTVNYN